MYPFLAMSLMGYGSQGHNPLTILPEKHAIALYKKVGELQISETMVRRREQFLAPNGIHIPKVPTRRIDWENEKEF